MQKIITLSGEATGLYKEKGSKFMAFAYPVTSVKQVKQIIDALRKQHPKARHVCYAYYIGVDNEVFKMQDDGEPTGTAGKPIAGQIRSHGLSNTLVAVVRYFGGTKLGTSGLTKAFKEAANDALSGAEKTALKMVAAMQVVCSYDQLKVLKTFIVREKLSVIDQSFELDCKFIVGIDPLQKAAFEVKLSNITGLKAEYLEDTMLVI